MEKTKNCYLHKLNNEIFFNDGLLTGYTHVNKCSGKANNIRESIYATYDKLSKKQREELAKRWEKAEELPDGEYEYYFNLEDKKKIFQKVVQSLANQLNINYELNIK